MKKILLSICLLLSLIANAQNQSTDSKKKNVISLELSSNVGGNFGLAFEIMKNEDDAFKLSETLHESRIYKLMYSAGTLGSNSIYVNDIVGTGYSAEFGERIYFNKSDIKGFFFSNYFLFGNLEFDEDNAYNTDVITGDGNFYGKYKYLSLFAPEVGFKFLIAKTIAINLHVGTSWIIEIKGKGDIDNHMFDNWVTRAGLSIGYSF